MFPVIVPLVSSLPVAVASPVTRLCSLIADLYQRVLRKASYETTLWTRLLLSLSRWPPGRYLMGCTSGHCAARKLRWTVVTRSARAPRIALTMRMKLPLIRSLAVAPARAPILRYGVALLSTVLALIPTLFFSDIA